MKKLIVEVPAHVAMLLRSHVRAVFPSGEPIPGVQCDAERSQLDSEATLVRLLGDNLPCREADLDAGETYPRHECTYHLIGGRRLEIGAEIPVPVLSAAAGGEGDDGKETA